ncbi:MAG TPA: hypothetical protein VFA65_19125 [Bryobacteraceae bacterium]|nr:hypothetical protein [Bryobacteraceae bacterium]
MSVHLQQLSWILWAVLLWHTASKSLQAQVKPAAVEQTSTTPEIKLRIEGEGAEKSKDSRSELLKSIAELISALTWPAIVLILFARYHTQIGEGLGALASRMKQAENIELGPLKLALSKSADLAAEIPTSPNPQDQRTAIQQQTRLAENLRAKVALDPEMLPEVRKKMDELARQYELLRSARDKQSRQASQIEIVAMNKVVSQMRALALSCLPYWDEYAQSDRPGDRLAAVVIVQMSPDPKYLNWLANRFQTDRPFIFYHAAVALQNMADQCWTEARDQIRNTAQQALKQVRSFDGVPDPKTVDILEGILQR